MDNIKTISEEVEKLLSYDNSGHGMDHVNRVVNIAITIAKKENANIDLVSATALLHDVDDYKLFGEDCSKNLTNAKVILGKTNFNDDEKSIIINSIKTIGYSKRLDGIVPQLLEAKIVSDADMLDGMGIVGILRSYHYNISHNNPFFDKHLFPDINMDAVTYKQKKNGTVVNHIFEKILKLKDLMLTKAGKEEAERRYYIIVDFLKEYFYEENADEWIDYLYKYTKVKLK